MAVALLALPVELPLVAVDVPVGPNPNPVELPLVAVDVVVGPNPKSVSDWLVAEEEDPVVVGTVNPVAEETTVLVHEHDGSNESIVKTYTPEAEGVEEPVTAVVVSDAVAVVVVAGAVEVAVASVFDGTVTPVADVTMVLVHEHDGSNESIVKTYTPLEEEAAWIRVVVRARMVSRRLVREVRASILAVDIGCLWSELRTAVCVWKERNRWYRTIKGRS